jgi:hypothetical protein
MSFFGLGPFELILGAGAIVAVGAVVWTMRGSGGKIRKTVTFLMPGERRGVELRVTKETDYGLYTKKSEGVSRRFIKLARGYAIKRGSSNVVTFFGLEGTIFTAAPGKISMRRNLAETLKFLWGEPFYDQIPEPERKIVEAGTIGVTVEVDPSDLEQLGITEDDESEEGRKILRMSSVDVNAETDAQVLETIANANKPKVENRRELYQMLIGMGLGFGLCLFLASQGWIKI